MSHSVTEDWRWITQLDATGTTLITGVVFPNGDQIIAKDMSPQRWVAYLRKGGLRVMPSGKLGLLVTA